MHYCSRCGSAVNDEDRCCMKCGALNPFNSKNAGVEADKIEVLDFDTDTEKLEQYLDGKIAKGTRSASIVNMIFVLISWVLTVIFLKDYVGFGNLILILIGSLVYVMLGILPLQRLLMKADLPWWGLYVPLYNVYLLYRLGFERVGSLIIIVLLNVLLSFYGVLSKGIIKGDYHLYQIITIIVLIAYFIIEVSFYVRYCIGVGKRFGKPGWFKALIVFFMPIMFIILAFDGSYGYNKPNS